MKCKPLFIRCFSEFHLFSIWKIIAMQRCDWKRRNYNLVHNFSSYHSIRAYDAMEQQKSVIWAVDNEAGTRVCRKSSLSKQDVSARVAPGTQLVAKNGHQRTVKEAPWTMLSREISEETELSWALMSRKNWISGKRDTGIQRRKVEVRARMAHSRQGTGWEAPCDYNKDFL